MNSVNALKQKFLDYDLSPIHIRELLYLTSSPCDVYAYTDGLYQKVIYQNTKLDVNTFKDLIKSNMTTLFVDNQQRDELSQEIRSILRRTIRSLSIGDPVANGKKAMSLATVTLYYLYKNPTDDDLLNLQYQAMKNIFSFLYEHPKIHLSLYLDFMSKKHHFVYAQPMISSFLLLGILKYSKLFLKKDCEHLFICSYFKDIGMSALPEEKYDSADITDQDKKVFSNHPILSVEILKGRMPLPPQYFDIVKHHHFLSLLDTEVSGSSNYLKLEAVLGSETMFVCILDIVAAMISGRPYREKSKVFEALTYIKPYMLAKYPHEFKIMVNYFRQFFKL